MPLSIVKMHGAENDFVLLDLRGRSITDLAAFARRVCDRHAGVGADGVLAIEACEGADPRMRVINAAGREAEMCGNGIRCVTRDLDAGRNELRIATGAGVLTAQIVARTPEYLVRVAMGEAQVLARDPAVIALGNPHLVFFAADAETFDLQGAAAAARAAFPSGINVHVAQALDERTIRVRHYERGVGLTQACGTGAVACAVAGIERGALRSPVVTLVPGGRLEVEWDGEQAWLTGQAAHVFDAALAGGFGDE